MKSLKFLTLLMRKAHLTRKLKHKEVAIFNVSGNYGNYQIKIGAEDETSHMRPIEINGKIHHLFVNKEHVEPIPTKDEIDHNLRGTIIMNDVTVHLFDSKGDGRAVTIEHVDFDGAHPRESINLAGTDGEKLMHEIEATGKLANETYHIVQEDILKSLQK